MTEKPTTITIDRAVFLDVAGSAFAAYMLAQASFIMMAGKGIAPPAEADKMLSDLVSLAKRSGKLVELAVPRLEQALDEFRKAMVEAATQSVSGPQH